MDSSNLAHVCVQYIIEKALKYDIVIGFHFD